LKLLHFVLNHASRGSPFSSVHSVIGSALTVDK
jgi:hypothetical protein